MPVSSFIRPQPELLQPEVIRTTVVKGAFKSAPRKERRTVHFKGSVSVRPVRHLNDFTDDEIRNVWYNKREFTQIKQDIAATVKRISAGLLNVDSEDYCIRGVEHRTRQGATLRKANKIRAVDAVLDEQDRQRRHGIFDDVLISKVFVNTNLICRLAALERGIVDKEVASALDMEDDESDDDCSSANEMDYNYFGSDMRDPQSRNSYDGMME